MVLVNWNTRRHLLLGLAALTEGPQGMPQANVVIVDNGSSDGSVTAVQAAYPDVRVIANASNPGYGAALNQGVAATRAPYLLLANADVECPPATVEALAAFLASHPHVGVVGPQLRAPEGTLQLSWGRDPHLVTECWQRWWWRRLEARPGQRWLRRAAAASQRVDWVLGACLMIRRATLDAIGGFDPRYHMYFEEVDVMTRARRAGWETWYVPAAVVVHHGRASTAQLPEAMALAYRRSQMQYYRRFHGAWAAALLQAYLRAKLVWTPHGRRLLQRLATDG